MRAWRRYVCFFLLLSSAGCALFKPADRFGARPVSFSELPGWEMENHAEALHVFLASCPILAKKPRPASGGSNLELPQDVWQSLCSEAAWAKNNPLQARAFFEQRFIPYRVNNNGNERGLFTGYYEPILYGSTRKQGDFAYPLYMAPPELAKTKPFYTHAEIANGALDGRRLELIWVDDPVMIFFMQIQGSGRVRLMNGKELYVGYADGNGHSYVSLGKIMGDEGLLPKDQINFFTIRQWLYQNRSEAFTLMQRNPSFIFFKLRDEPAVGSVGAVLTPQRSLAVDSRYIPYGLPVYLETELPAYPQQQPAPFRRIMIAQDTGGAIKGPVRGDIFFGPGDEAEYFAGYMKGRGVYTLLVPREIAHQIP